MILSQIKAGVKLYLMTHNLNTDIQNLPLRFLNTVMGIKY